jgi:hypothetical protein
MDNEKTVTYSAISGKKIKMKRALSKKDKELSEKRAKLLEFLNGTYDD